MLDILLPRVVDPDSRVHGTSYTDQVYDLKTCGHRVQNKSKTSSCGYGGPCPKKTPVQFMEDEVPGLWQTKIRNVDTKWNQTKGGDLGAGGAVLRHDSEGRDWAGGGILR